MAKKPYTPIIALPDHARQIAPHLVTGLEKESLRHKASGSLALTPHPPALGHALTHSMVLTDFSESMLECVTPPHHRAEHARRLLEYAHAYIYPILQDSSEPEFIWPCSMPCRLPDASHIPIAEYGPYPWGQIKNLYRRGLAQRYGRFMQTIAGVHFNISFSDNWFEDDAQFYRQSELPLPNWKNTRYFQMLQQYERHEWLIAYLFGASPTFDTSFGFPAGIFKHPHVQRDAEYLRKWDEHTLYAPYATSLRLSSIGYRNGTQPFLEIDHRNLADYIASMEKAMQTPFAPYHALTEQLSPALLQLEDEYYTGIRPKNQTRKYERMLHALHKRGVAYLEMRSLDLDPFDPLGIALSTQHFMELWSCFCLLSSSQPDPRCTLSSEIAAARFEAVLLQGRDPQLTIPDETGAHWPVTVYAKALLDELEPLAHCLDLGHPNRPYAHALRLQQKKCEEPESLPSARILNGLHAAEKTSGAFLEWGLLQSKVHAQYYQNTVLPPAVHAHWDTLAEQSRAAALQPPGPDYAQTLETLLAHYLAPVGHS